MKVEIINKPMLCWDEDEDNATEWHVLAKITECDTLYPFKVIDNENTPGDGGWGGRGRLGGYKNAKPLQETVELTVAEISKLLGKNVKIVK